jgi:hypothetical protein
MNENRAAFRVDDHLVQPEITRDEIINGRRVVASPAHPPHAKQQTKLDYVLEAHVASGYTAATDLLTRQAKESNFATDTCIYKDAIDPETGARYLEEIAFEIVSEQTEREAAEKALVMSRRGVRRIFALFIKGPRRVCEWSPQTESWLPLDPGSSIEDPCLVTPLAVKALLDAAEAHKAVLTALAAQGNSALLEREAAAEARGEAMAILKVLEARGLAVSEAQREEILGCHDREQLDRWLQRAVLVSSAEEITSES